MIGTLLRLPFLAVGVVILLWVLALLRNPDAPLVPHLRSLGFEAAFSEDRAREAILSSAWQRADWISRALAARLGSRADRFRGPIGLAALNADISLRVLPPFLPLLCGSILGGIAFRERIRRAEGYASPTAAYLARYHFALGILFVLAFALSPLPLPIWTLYVALSATSFGGFLYVSNLPLSL